MTVKWAPGDRLASGQGLGGKAFFIQAASKRLYDREPHVRQLA